MKAIAFERVSLAEAKRVHDGVPSSTARQDWSNRRAVATGESLFPATIRWMEELPAELRPHHVAERYVRIANKICSLWNQPVRCSNYLAELLIVRRSKREGFPLAVATEIGNLGAHYATLHPPERAWTETA